MLSAMRIKSGFGRATRASWRGVEGLRTQVIATVRSRYPMFTHADSDDVLAMANIRLWQGKARAIAG